MNAFIQTIRNRIALIQDSPKRSRALSLALLGVFALFLTIPLFVSLSKGCLQGRDDLSYHLNRILSIADGLRGGQFPVKVYPDALSGYGYASPLFYPDLFLYFPAFLTFLGIPLGVSYAIFVFVMLFASGCFYYLFAKKLFGEGGALFAGTLFMGGHYTYAIALYMAGLGQALAAAFAPLVLLGVYNMVRENFSKPWILLLAELGITFSHTLSLAVYGVFLLVVVLLHAKKLFPDPRWWGKVGIIFLFYLGIAACYFVPLIEQFASAKFLQSVAWAKLSDYAIPFANLFFYGNPLLRRYVVRFSVGIVGFLCLFLVCFIKRTQENKRTLNRLYALIGAILGLQLLVSDLVPWHLLDETVLSVLQFPFRLLMIAQLLLPITIALIVRELRRSPLLKVPKPVFTVLAVAIFAVNGVYSLVYVPDWNEVDLNETRIHEYIGTGEWIPLYEEAQDMGDYRQIFTVQTVRGEEGEVPFFRKAHSTTISFRTEAGWYELPLLYYKGYAAKDENGNALEVRPTSEGRVSVLAEGGEVTVFYDGTPLQTASFVVSALSVLSFCLFWRRYGRK